MRGIRKFLFKFETYLRRKEKPSHRGGMSITLWVLFVICGNCTQLILIFLHQR